MGSTKNTSVYLENDQINYLALMSIISGLNKSQYIRQLLDEDMLENEEIVRAFENILFS